jgi:putative nucleotidyltransferase with HDIG domain
MSSFAGPRDAVAQTLTIRAAIADRIATGRLDIPLLHDVAHRVLSMSSSSAADAKNLAELIYRDQALATHVLRIANSPAYLPRERIDSLQQAIARLGIMTLRNIVIAVSVRSRVFSFGTCESYARTLWRHSFGAALFAREVARRANVDSEAAFMAGLLHDIGKPIVLKVVGDLGDHYVDILGPTLLRLVLEEHHLAVGTKLGETWHLPQTVVQAIAFHHDWASAQSSKELVMAVALADSFAECLGPDFMPDDAPRHDPRTHPALRGLRLTAQDVADVLARKGRLEALVDSTDGVTPA